MFGFKKKKVLFTAKMLIVDTIQGSVQYQNSHGIYLKIAIVKPVIYTRLTVRANC